MISSIDAHQHFWKFTAEEYGWIDDSMQALRRDFLPADWREHSATSDVVASVAIQARQSMDETRWLLALAEQNPSIAGVVGWANLPGEEFAGECDELARLSKLVGLRHVIQEESAGFMDGKTFNENIDRLLGAGLAFDLLIREHQLPEAIAFVDRHPNQRFVLDHAAKPRIAAAEFDPWQMSIAEMGRRSNVACKLSGLITEADTTSWSLADLRPYLDTLVYVFGPERLMAGSDWPVCLLAGSFDGWWTVLRDYFGSFSEAEQQLVFRKTAEAFYGLAIPE